MKTVILLEPTISSISFDDFKVLKNRITKQEKIIPENSAIKSEMESFIKIYNILLENQPLSAGLSHNFLEENKHHRPRGFFAIAERHASENPEGITSKTLSILERKNVDERVDELVKERFKRKWIFFCHYDEVKKKEEDARTEIKIKLK